MNRPPDDPLFEEPIEANGSDKPFSLTKEAKFSWIVAIGILLAYASLAFFGANTIIKMEAGKHKYQTVEVEKPISFIDKTYVVEDANQSSSR